MAQLTDRERALVRGVMAEVNQRLDTLRKDVHALENYDALLPDWAKSPEFMSSLSKLFEPALNVRSDMSTEPVTSIADLAMRVRSLEMDRTMVESKMQHWARTYLDAKVRSEVARVVKDRLK